MSRSTRHPMDFEQWSQLACRDPAGFELMRREMIETMIGAASERCQQRLRGLQWRIDQVRTHSANPMSACISLSNMMWESFAGDDGLAQTLNSRRFTQKRVLNKAKVVPLVQRHK